MLSFAEAKERITHLPLPLQTERLPLWQANGRTLALDLYAKQDLPAWSNSAMDGYVFRQEDILNATPETPVCLPLSGTIQAGDTRVHTIAPHTCMRIFTGAPVPQNGNLVIMQENVALTKDGIAIHQCPKLWNNIRQKGEEAKSGALLLRKGSTLDAAAIGLALSASVHEVTVWKVPNIGILSTGDELKDPRQGGTLETGQIWATNSINLQMAFQSLGMNTIDCGIAKDTLQSTTETFIHAIETQQCDMLVSTGGVSVGDFDVVHKALNDLPGYRVEMNFWKVRMKPGKPVAIGVIYTPTKEIPLFALPGNPVSALMGFYQFVQPFVFQKMGMSNPELPTQWVTLGEDFTKRGSRLEFVRVWLQETSTETLAFSTGNQSSAWMSSLADASALLPFPADQTRLAKGTKLQVQRLPGLSKWPATWRT